MSDPGNNVTSFGRIIRQDDPVRPANIVARGSLRTELLRRLIDARIRGVVEGKGRQKTQKNNYIPPLRQVAGEAFNPDSYYDEHLQNIASRLSDMNAFDERFLLVVFHTHYYGKNPLSFIDTNDVEKIKRNIDSFKTSRWAYPIMVLDAYIPLEKQLTTISGQPYISPHHAKNDPVISQTYLQALKDHTPEPHYR